LPIGGEHARHQLVLRIAARGVAHHALVFRELGLEAERVLPVEFGGRLGARRLIGTLFGGLRHDEELLVGTRLRLPRHYRAPCPRRTDALPLRKGAIETAYSDRPGDRNEIRHRSTRAAPRGFAAHHRLRAPMAHARIKRIDAATARGMPGVLFVGTGANVRADGLGNIPCVTPLNNRDGTPRHDTPRPVLAVGAVRHVGEPVALVVAETLAAARDAAEAIEVEYEGLPAVTAAKEAVAPGAPQL